MKTSRKGLMAIAAHEGIVLSRYKDAVGVWTIGVGHTANAGEPDPRTITRELHLDEVLEILARDVAKFEKRVSKAVKVDISQHEFDALVSFDFNTGGVHRASLTRLLNAGDRKAAGRAFMNWTKAGGKRLEALVKRRDDERAIFERGAYPAPYANVYKATASGKVLWSSAERVDLRHIFEAPPSITGIPDAETPPVKETPMGYIALILHLIAKLFGRKD